MCMDGYEFVAMILFWFFYRDNFRGMSQLSVFFIQHNQIPILPI